MRRIRAVEFAFLLLAATLSTACAREPAFPDLAGRVTDAANVIPADVETRLTGKLAELQARSGPQLVVATVPSLEGRDIDDYGAGLANHWGIGSKERNDGVLLLVAPNEHRLRIEVGTGLEAVLTDAEAKGIIDGTIVPRLKAGDMPGGIEAGADAVIAQLGAGKGENHAQPASR